MQDFTKKARIATPVLQMEKLKNQRWNDLYKIWQQAKFGVGPSLLTAVGIAEVCFFGKDDSE